MSRIEEINARLAVVDTDLVVLRELAEPTAEDLERTDALLDEKDTLRAELEPLNVRAERLTAVQVAAVEGGTERAFGNVNVAPRKVDPFENLSRIRTGEFTPVQVRDQALSTFEDKSVRHLNDEERNTLLERIDEVPGAAQYALAHGSADYRSAYSKFMDASGENVDYTDAERAAVREAKYMRAALNITTGASGQFSLPTVFDPTLIHTGTAAVNPIREISRVETGTQNVWNGASSGNVTTYWHGEAAALTEGSPTLAHPAVTAGHLTAFVQASWEFFDDSPMVAQLPGLIGEAFGFAESTAFVTGTGTSQPLGIVTAISATAGSTVTATTRGTFNAGSSGSELFRVYNALPSRYENTAKWIANKATYNVVRQGSPSGQGSLFWDTLSGGSINHPVLLGYPAYNSSDVLSTTTTGTVLLVLGDFSQYLIYDVLGTTVEFMQNIVNSSGLPTGSRGLIARKRVGANATDINAFRFFLC